MNRYLPIIPQAFILQLVCILSLTLCLFSTCTKKDLNLEIIELKCKDFKISNANVTNKFDPSCGGGATTGQFVVSFDYDGDSECLHHISLSPVFYNKFNNALSNITYNDSLPVSSPKVSVSGKHVTFTFDYTFADATNADALNFIYLRFETQNKIGNPSNHLEVRINTACSVVDPSTYNSTPKAGQPSRTVPVSSSTVKITFLDYAAEDGDIISVNLNNVWVLENYTITNAGQTFTFNINSGNNTLVAYAVNQGKSGPNTLAIQVNGGTKMELDPELLTGEAVKIVF